MRQRCPSGMNLQLAGAALLGLLALQGCGERSPGRPEAPDTQPSPVETLALDVLRVLPHDTSSFTQGLFLHPDGTLIESTGGYGGSSLQRVDATTGEVLHSTRLDSMLFGEGCCLKGDTVYQLTWRERTVLLYDAGSLERIGELPLETDGWGICSDGSSLIVSDGTGYLYYRQPGTLALEDRVRVTRAGTPLPDINELEYADGQLYANVLRSDSIYRIDPVSGRVTGIVDASGLRDRAGVPGSLALNGIAWLPESGTFVLTGKLWPLFFEVRLHPAGEE